MKPFCPELRLVDSHSTPDTKNCGAFTYQIKPDLCVYSDTSSTGCDSSTVEMTVEFKWDPGHDAFTRPYITPNQSMFISDNNTALSTLGQITAYASAQLGSQFRTHCFSVLVVCEIAYIIRWDREGAVVTTPIKYAEDKTLAEFFWRYSQASPQLRGVDTTVNEATGEEARVARQQLSLPEKTRMLKITQPVESSDSLLLIFPAPAPPGYPPVGRATRACPAYEWHGKRTVFLKDSWRVLLDGILSEGETYARLNSAGVRNVPTCIASGDVECIPEQQPQTVRLSKEWWSCTPINLVPHTHHRLVLNIAGTSLMSFGSVRELVTAIRDGLIGKSYLFNGNISLIASHTAHMDALHKSGILHRDMSPGNVIIHFGNGLLIDWDLAKLVNSGGCRQTTRTVRLGVSRYALELMTWIKGTWQFMSVSLLYNPTNPHTFTDDLESCFWVLLWTALMTIPSSLSLDARSVLIEQVFDDIGEAGAGRQKKFFLCMQEEFKKPLFPKHPALCQLLIQQADIFKCLYDTPPPSEAALIERLRDGPNADENISLTVTHRIQKGRLALENHDALIHAYNECLNHDWAYDAPADPQPVKPPKPYGEDSQPHIMSKSSQMMMLVPMETKRAKKRRKLEGSPHITSSGSSGYSTEPVAVQAEQEGSSATIKGMRRSPAAAAAPVPD